MLPKISQRIKERKIFSLYLLGILSCLFFLFSKYFFLPSEKDCLEKMRQASEIMSQAIDSIRKCREGKKIGFNQNDDPNRTGLIGLEYSSITTSLGNLRAKRTTTNPNFAALMVYLLKKAGVKEGETIAVGASSSFPALIIATLSASKALGLNPLLICSLGASQWGANDPDFHWIEMERCLRFSGIFEIAPLAYSIGGDEDVGSSMEEEGFSLLFRAGQETAVLFLGEAELQRNVEKRLSLYKEKAGRGGVRAFINIGGNWANLGRSSSVLKVKPGLARVKEYPPQAERGVLHEMALGKIPVIHLLHIQGLAARYDLPWDPIPLPKPGQGKIYQLARDTRTSFFIAAGIYFLLVFFILAVYFKNKNILF